MAAVGGVDEPIGEKLRKDYLVGTTACVTSGDCDRGGAGNDSSPAQVSGLLRKLPPSWSNNRCIDRRLAPREAGRRKLARTNPTLHRNPRRSDRSRLEPGRVSGIPDQSPRSPKHRLPSGSSAPPSGGTQLMRDQNAGRVSMVPPSQADQVQGSATARLCVASTISELSSPRLRMIHDMRSRNRSSRVR
jgi:hypothetical protein